MKNIRIFYPKNCHFLVVKFSVYLNGRVFVMSFVGAVLLAILYISFALFMNIISPNLKRLKFLKASSNVT